MRFAYADPPYLGMGKRLYGKHHPDAASWDDINTHLGLIDQLVDGFPDGWALSCLQRDLRWVMPAVPDDCRVAAWVKPFGSGYKPGQRIIWAWEPVVFRTARTREPGTRVRDVLSANATRQVGLPGAKPDTFNQWVISLLGCGPDDELVDLFPGSGGLARARDQGRLAL